MVTDYYNFYKIDFRKTGRYVHNERRRRRRFNNGKTKSAKGFLPRQNQNSRKYGFGVEISRVAEVNGTQNSGITSKVIGIFVIVIYRY